MNWVFTIIFTFGYLSVQAQQATPGSEEESTTASQVVRVTLLGTGGPRPRTERFGYSTLIEVGEKKLLFDSGRGVAIRLAHFGIPLREITSLFITHLHSDHIVGIPDIWLSGWTLRRTEPFKVWGPEGTVSMMTHLEKAYDFDIRTRREGTRPLSEEGIRVVATDISEGLVFNQDGVRVTAFKVEHGAVKPSYGYRVDFEEKGVCISGDTGPSENLIRVCKGVDLLVHEVLAIEIMKPAYITEIWLKALRELHTSPQEAGRIFSQIRPKLAVFSHYGAGSASYNELAPLIREETRKTYAGPLIVGNDLMRFVISEDVTLESPQGMEPN